MKKRLLTAILLMATYAVGYSQCPQVNALADQSICETTTQVTLGATITDATSVLWTTDGSGSFIPDNTADNPVYQPSPADINAGTVTLAVKASAVGCPDATDDLVLTISKVPSVVADVDRTECVDVNSIPLNATVTNIGATTTITWTASGGGTIQNANTASATYLVQPQDVTNGSVHFTITVTAGACPTATDGFTATFVAVPTVDAGPNQIECGNNPSTLNGTVGGSATGGVWSSSGTGTFLPNATDLQAVYHPSAADFASGTGVVTLTLKTTGGCRDVTDQMTITYKPMPTANAGPNVSVCSTASPVSLNGSVGGSATGGIWTSNGTGTFSPNATTLAATYTPSAADLTVGHVILTLTATGGCDNTVNDKMQITFNATHTADAGPDKTICATNIVAIDATASGTILWTSDGSGTFTPDNTSVDVTYTASPTDIDNGTVTLTITASGGSCPDASDAMVLTISSVCISGVSSANSNENLIKIFPNPATEYAQIELSTELTVTDLSVYDVLGAKVSSTTVSGSNMKIDLTNLNKGVYYFTFTDESGNRITKRFIKQ